MSEMDLVIYCREHASKPGHNEYGVPLHACNGYRHDEHYWAWVATWCHTGRRP